jgi:hypothetical protein
MKDRLRAWGRGLRPTLWALAVAAVLALAINVVAITLARAQPAPLAFQGPDGSRCVPDESVRGWRCRDEYGRHLGSWTQFGPNMVWRDRYGQRPSDPTPTDRGLMPRRRPELESGAWR